MSIAERVKRVVGSLCQLEPRDIGDDAHLQRELGINSLDVLILRDNLERVFAIMISDVDVPRLTTVGAIVSLVSEKLSDEVPRSTERQAANASGGAQVSESLGPRGVFHSEFEVGMPHTGRNNLAETPLLRLVGDLRWRHMSLLTGVPSREVADEAGERLYPTFFYVEVRFPENQPMASYGENDRFTIVSVLRRYGLSFLDGESYLFPADLPAHRKAVPTSADTAIHDGIPLLRLSNSFVQQWKGAEWLKRSRPANPGFQRIPEVAEIPDSYGETMERKDGGHFFLPDHRYVSVLRGASATYEIDRDRDLNGAGLLYFANYPSFLDVCERRLLSDRVDHPLLDRRTLVHRKSAYLGNATADDALRVEVDAWVENTLLDAVADPDIAPVRLLLNFRMLRASDGRVIMVSSARKVLLGANLADAPGLLELVRRP
jgi:acyl carrier protein